MELAVVGVGLIGGSIGLAARERLGARVRGYDPASGVLERARARGALDVACASLAEAVDGAEVAFVAAPVGVLPALLEDVLAAAPTGCVVSDVGSTKRAIAEACDDERFVGGHPLAGAETAGVEHARADLFDDAAWYLTPGERTSERLYDRLRSAIAAFGAHPRAIGAVEHDMLLASISHLPHVLANVLLALGAEALGDERLPAGGPSFRDATRVAGANSAIWTDIYLANRDALADRIDDAIARLEDVRTALRTADAEGLGAWQEAAGELRRLLLEERA